MIRVKAFDGIAAERAQRAVEKSYQLLQVTGQVNPGSKPWAKLVLHLFMCMFARACVLCVCLCVYVCYAISREVR